MATCSRLGRREPAEFRALTNKMKNRQSELSKMDELWRLSTSYAPAGAEVTHEGVLDGELEQVLLEGREGSEGADLQPRDLLLSNSTRPTSRPTGEDGRFLRFVVGWAPWLA